MKKLLTMMLVCVCSLLVWSQNWQLASTSVGRIADLDMTGQTYYVLQFVNGNHYYINAGSVSGDKTSLSLGTTLNLTEDNMFCIEVIDPAPTGTDAEWPYRLKTKSGKYLGYDSGKPCVYDAIKNEIGTENQRTTPIKFVDGTFGSDNFGISVQRNGQSWKALNYNGSTFQFGQWVGEVAELRFWNVEEAAVVEPEVLDYTVPVYLFAGQSNMDGRAAISGYPQYMQDYKTAGAQYAYWSYTNGKTWAWNQFGGKFEAYRPYNDQVSTVANNTGFDGVVYHQIEEALGKKFYVIKESLGGAPIDPNCDSWQKGWWYADAAWMASHNPQGDNASLAKEFTNNISACIDNVLSQLQKGYDIKCIVWHQGCSDRTAASSYKENLHTLVNYLRNFIATKTGDAKYLKLPFICCKINPNSTQYDATVDQAKHELAAEIENFYEVSFADCSLGSDNLHHDAAGNIKGAGRVYDKLVELGLVSTDVWTAGETVDPNPDPDFNDETHVVSVDINGGWQFLKKSVEQGTLGSQTGWVSVDLPHTWNALDGQDGGNNYHRGACWYRKTISVPAEAAGKTTYLNFAAANMTTTVYIDGQLVGTHTGGYARFMFDVTNFIAGKTQAVVDIRVDNSASIMSPPLGGDFTFFGGITRDLSLEILPNTHIAPTHTVNTSYLSSPVSVASSGVTVKQSNVSAASANLDVKVQLANKTGASVTRTVEVIVYEKNGAVKTSATKQVTLAAGAATSADLALTVSSPHLWNGKKDPYLYKVHVALKNGDAVEHKVIQPLGLRYWEISKTEGFKLNGVSYPLRGIAIHDAVKDKGRAASDADRKLDLDLMLETGANYLRLAHYQHGDFTYDYLDEKGIICWTEIPVVEQTAPSQDKHAEFQQNCTQQLYELIRQCENHPSVICWGVANEIRQASGVNQKALVQHLNNVVHAEDHRPSTLAHNGWYEECAVTDVVSFNIYQGWYNGSYDGFGGAFDGHNNRTGQPMGVSEYGAGGNTTQHEYPASKPATTGAWHPEEYMNAYHESHLRQINARPYMWHSSLWVGIDFASDHRAEGNQPGINDKGLVTFDRAVKKDIFYLYKAAWNEDEPTVYITSRRWTERDGKTFPVRVYTNCDRVTLYVNDVEIGTANATNHVAEWLNVEGQFGSNTIKVKGTYKGIEQEDEVVWTCKETINPTDMFEADIQVNFATSGTNVDGYMLDCGNAYGDRGNGYNFGWESDMTGQTRNRTSYTTDARLATFIQMQPNTETVNHTWKIALPNGTYRVGISVGDNDYTDSHNVIDANGVTVVDFTPATGKKFGAGTAEVEVTDGFLTIAPAATSSNAKINFIHIQSLAANPVAEERKMYFKGTNPAEGSTVAELTVIEVITNNAKNSEAAKPMQVVDAEDNVLYEGTPVIKSDAENTYVLTLTEAVTETGTYRLVIPAGCVRLQSGGYNEYEHRFTFKVKNPNDVSYTTNWDGQSSTNGNNRYTPYVKLTSPKHGAQSIATGQTAGKMALVWDLTESASAFTCEPGETLGVAVDFQGGWMNAYVYIDEDKNGFAADDSNIGSDHVLKKGTDIDLRSYSKYNDGPNGGTNYDSNGTQLSTGDIVALPSITAPTTPGTYRMRYKVDWNNIDPKGATPGNAGGNMQENGGIIVDVLLNVTTAYKVVEKTTLCNLYMPDGVTQLSAAVTDGDLTFKLVPMEGYTLDGTLQIKVGDKVTEISADDIPADGLVTISDIDGDVTITAACAQGPEATWMCIFNDEFNEEMIGWDDNKWGTRPLVSTVTWARFNSQRKEDGVCVQRDGHMSLMAKPTGTNTMLTGNLTSQEKFDFTYGRVEARCLVHPHKGNFPAFWMIPSAEKPNYSGDGGTWGAWPNSGEIDIMEQINTENRAYHTIHSHYANSNKGGLGQSYQKTANEYVDMNGKWHIYALEWEKEQLRWYVDGTQVHTYDRIAAKDNDSDCQWPFDRPFYILVNQSVGDGSWASTPDFTHTYCMDVDYVRVYQRCLPTAICHATADNLATVRTSDGRIIVSTPYAMRVAVYDLSGKIVYVGLVNGTQSIPVAAGIYIAAGSKVIVG